MRQFCIPGWNDTRGWQLRHRNSQEDNSRGGKLKGWWGIRTYCISLKERSLLICYPGMHVWPRDNREATKEGAGLWKQLGQKNCRSGGSWKEKNGGTESRGWSEETRETWKERERNEEQKQNIKGIGNYWQRRIEQENIWKRRKTEPWPTSSLVTGIQKENNKWWSDWISFRVSSCLKVNWYNYQNNTKCI